MFDEVKRTRKDLNKLYKGSIEGGGIFKSDTGTTYENPIHGLFGYLAKHNLDQNIGYQSMKIYNLRKYKIQNYKNFEAIRYLFLHFEHSSLT